MKVYRIENRPGQAIVVEDTYYGRTMPISRLPKEAKLTGWKTEAEADALLNYSDPNRHPAERNNTASKTDKTAALIVAVAALFAIGGYIVASLLTG